MTTVMPYLTGDGGPYDGEGYAVGAVTSPVPSAVPSAVTPGVPPAVSPAVPPGDGEDGEGEPLGWVGTDRWVPAGEEPAGTLPAPDLRPLGARLAGSELLGGGRDGLIAALADPRPGTWAEHLAHIADHPYLPDDDRAALAFTIAHLALTAPYKGTGKTLVLTGQALTWAGLRIDWLGDRAARAAAVITAVAVITTLVFIFIIR